jgi:hypothetical protein
MSCDGNEHVESATITNPAGDAPGDDGSITLKVRDQLTRKHFMK